jgi:hypothetical protein
MSCIVANYRQHSRADDPRRLGSRSNRGASGRGRAAVCYDAPMPYYGKITGTNNGVEGTWLVELDDDGVPTPEFMLVPPESMPDVVPVWTIHLKESPDPERAFSRDEVRRIAFIKMRRSMDWLQGRDAGS